MIRSLLPVVSSFRRRSRNKATGFHQTVSCESRVLLTVTWANQLSDGFDTYFGANAATARGIVNHAIQDWNRMVTTNLSLTISASTLSGSTAGVTSNIVANGGKPISATIQLDNDGAGNGWYFDSTITDDSEFSNITSAWSGFSPGMTTVDLYSIVAHEIGHAIGIANTSGLAINSFLTNNGTGYTFYNPNGFYKVSESLQYSMHTQVTSDLMYSSFAPGERRLISDRVVKILGDAYSYATSLPSIMDNIHVNLTASGILVTPATGAFNDVMTVEAATNMLRFTVNGMSEQFTGLGYVPITMNGGDGHDTIVVNSSQATVTPVTVNGGAGSDVGIFRAPSIFNYHTVVFDNIVGTAYNYVGPSPYPYHTFNVDEVSVTGTTGADWLDVYANTYSRVRFLGGDGDDLVNGANSNTPIWSTGGNGNDTLTGGSAGDILEGDAGVDTISGNLGRDLIIGGLDADVINANSTNDEDLIIGGSTSFDTNFSSLSPIQGEWASSRTRAERIANLSGTGTGTRINGNLFLIPGSTVFDDLVTDNVSYQLNIDWLFA